jgi:type I restriction enzyme S subunit
LTQSQHGAGIPALDSKIILNLPIQIPPLPTQLKIVEVLDKFTELQTELKLRKKQYEYYRDKLLTFSEEEREKREVRVVRLGDVCMINRGASPRPIQHYITKDNDGVNWLKIGDVENNAKYIYKTKEKITKEGVEKSRLCKKGDLILSTTMSWGRPYILATDCCIHDGWSLISGFDKNEILPDYLYYYLKSNQVQKFWQNSQNTGSVSNLNTDIIKQTKLEIPILTRQKEIVEILDKFDTLVNDISKGLPREIALRKKQYEYYRERLVRFE